MSDPHPVSPAVTVAPPAEPTAAERRYWQRARVLAAQLVAEGQLSHNDIAERVGKSRTWLTESKRHPLFRARVADLVADLAEAARVHGIANQALRLEEQDGRWRKMQQIIAERASDRRYEDEPGYKTGLLVHDWKTTKDDAYDVFKVDDGLLGEMRALEAQVAKELGQTAERASQGDTNIVAGQVNIFRAVPELGI